MGKKKTGNITLLQFWKTLEKDNTLIHGPNTAIKLQKGNKTILLFGESHRDIPSCGKGEKNFADLFKELMLREKCSKTDIILELSEEYNSKTNKESLKLKRLLKMYEEHYLKNKEKCNIVRHFGNPTGFNVFAKRRIREFSDKEISAKIAARMLSEYLSQFIKKEDIIFSELLKLRKKHPQIYEELKPYVDNTHKSSENSYIQLTNKTPQVKLFFKAYNDILDMMNIYMMSLAFLGADNVLIYGGTLHIMPIAANLITFHNFGITGFGESLKPPYEGFCVRLTPNIKAGIESIEKTKLGTEIKEPLAVFKRNYNFP